MAVVHLFVRGVLIAAVVGFVATSAGAQDTAPRVYTQAAEVAPSQERGAPPKGEPVKAAADTSIWKQGPTPQWIWGDDPNKKYYLRTEFDGPAKFGQLRVTCDNQCLVRINDRIAARNSDWQVPGDADVTDFLKPGKNVIEVEATNEGSVAGLALKLVLSARDNTQRHVVTDASWTAKEVAPEATAKSVKVIGPVGIKPWGDAFYGNVAPTDSIVRDVFNVLPGFKVERLFTVPKDQLGSWVNIVVDSKGRIIASDQGNQGLCRITPSPIGSSEPSKVERLDVKINGANISGVQGFLFAFDSLYVMCNGGPGSGLYRLRDTNNDDQFDEVVKLKDLQGGGEHGPHALLLSPDGKSIYCLAGNHTKPPFEVTRNSDTQTMGGLRPQQLRASLSDYATSRLVPNWDEDLVLPRQWDGNGHAAGILAPGGWVARTDPDGKTWDMFSVGYRNPFDMAFNADGELFVYDADMEWDYGMPWYRPTRVSHSPSGSELGWRSGTGKWAPYYVDSLPATVDIGPGSPVGATFGYGSKFPAKYQKAMYVCDWTFGTMYALHFEPNGASYKGVKEEFISRTPLPLTDAVVGRDGALYFSIGGRGTQSELFRVTYVGNESTAPANLHDSTFAEQRALRHQLEALHRKASDPSQALDLIWKHLGHADRYIRYAARVALEHQDVALWQDRVIGEQDPETLITAAVALARQGDKPNQTPLLGALDRMSYSSLNDEPKLELLRAYQLILTRLGTPEPAAATKLIAKLDPLFPSGSEHHDRELSNVLVALKSPTIVAKATAELAKPSIVKEAVVEEVLLRNPGYGGTVRAVLANSPDAQKIHYLFALRNVKEGWTLDERKTYFTALNDQRSKKGGASYMNFLKHIDAEAFDNASDKERLAIEAFGARQPFKLPELPKPKGPGKDWTLAELVELSKDNMSGRDFANGVKMYAAARCVICHRFAGDGGATGPDLTQLAGRFNFKDMSEAIVDPSKVISDQYKASIIQTSDGKSITGRVVSESKDSIIVVVDPEDATKNVTLRKDKIEEHVPSNVSLMPKDLLKALNQDEALDLMAYLLSRGNKNDPMFKPSPKKGRK